MRNYSCLILAIAAACIVSRVEAYPTLTLSDGLGDTLTDDNGVITTTGNTKVVVASDSDGVITVDATLGVWTVASNTGMTGAATDGSATDPDIALDFDDTSKGAGTLTITWTDEFGPLNADQLNTTLASTLAKGATETYSVLEGSSVLSNESVSSQVFSGTQTPVLTAAYSTGLEEKIVLTNTAKGTDSGFAEVAQVPDNGSSLGFAALGLAGLLALARRYRPSLFPQV